MIDKYENKKKLFFVAIFFLIEYNLRWAPCKDFKKTQHLPAEVFNITI